MPYPAERLLLARHLGGLDPRVIDEMTDLERAWTWETIGALQKAHRWPGVM